MESQREACPRCRGLMIMERDWYGSYSTCIACGHVREVITTPPIDLRQEAMDGERRQRRRQPSHGKLRL